MLSIKVLGPGCMNCQKMEELVRQGVAQLSIEAQVTKVKETAQILAYPITRTPGLVINERLVCSGRIPTQAEVVTWLADALSVES